MKQSEPSTLHVKQWSELEVTPRVGLEGVLHRFERFPHRVALLGRQHDLQVGDQVTPRLVLLLDALPPQTQLRTVLRARRNRQLDGPFRRRDAYLAAGVHFVPLILGFFAITEALVQGRYIAAGTREAPKLDYAFPSFREFWAARVTMVRSVVIGFFSGLLPGIGATLASFLSYSEAMRWSKHPERFGKGELEGVIASETANNAATGGAMIPLLALGLPGGALTAVMVGAFQIHGMEPGPLVLITSKELVWVVFVAMFLANVAILLLGWVETKTTVHLLKIPFGILGPMIVVISAIGAYALRNLVIDVWVMFAAGIIGYFLRRSGYSMPGIVLGVILGKIGESNFVKTMQMLDYDPIGFLARPVSMVLLVFTALTLVFSIRTLFAKSRGERPA